MTNETTTVAKTPESATQGGSDPAVTLVPAETASVAGKAATGAGEVDTAPASPFAPLVERWVQGYVYNSPLSENTAAYNHLRQVLPYLIAMLEKGL